MTQPFTFTLMGYLETASSTLKMTTPQLEWLEPNGTSVSVVQTDEPTVEKAYINGSKQYRIGYEVYAQGEKADRISLIQLMDGYLQVFTDMRGNVIGDGVTVQKVETTTPSLRAQTENGVLRYGFSATIIYKD